jgi:hypothetical protein
MIKAMAFMPKPNLGSTSLSSGLYLAVIIKAGGIKVVLSIEQRVA